MPDAAGARLLLAELTTLGVGGEAGELLVATSREEVMAGLAGAQQAGRPLLVLGGGSNVVIGDAGFPGTVLRMATTGRTAVHDGDDVLVSVEAGEEWGSFVDSCVEEGLAGVECLAGIPGSVGAVPVQNVGAYGQEVSATIESVEVWDRRAGAFAVLDAAACGFGYRTSRFKHRDQMVILSATFRLRRSSMSEPIRYSELARSLSAGVGERRPLAEVRDSVVALRRGKGMVIDPGDPDTRSVGSFFTNPVLSPTRVAELEGRVADLAGAPAAVPTFPADDGRLKVPAAWLIERAGFERGFEMGDAAISTKHTLALTVRRGRSAEPLLVLARAIRDRVEAVLGVVLEPEPVLVGVAL